MSNVISWVIKAQDQFSKTAKEININIVNITNNIHKCSKSADEMGDKLDKTLSKIEKKAVATKATISEFASGLTHLTAPLAAVSVGALHAASKYQQLQIAFTSMRGSIKGANDELRTILNFSRKGTFTFFDVASSEKLLRQSGVGKENIMKVMSDIGDISAGAGLPMGRLSRIVSGMVAQNYILYRDAKMLLPYHINLVADIAKRTHTSIADVQKAMSHRGGMPVSAFFEDIAKNYTAKGKMFADQMVKQADTIGGSFNKMKEGLEIAGTFFGLWLDKSLSISKSLHSVADVLQDKVAPFFEFLVTKKSDISDFYKNLQVINPSMYTFLKNIESQFPSIRTYASYFTRLISVLVVLGPALYTISKLARLVGIVFGPLAGIITAVGVAFDVMMAANPIALFITLIYAAGTAVYLFVNYTKQGQLIFKAFKQAGTAAFHAITNSIKEAWHFATKLVDKIQSIRNNLKHNIWGGIKSGAHSLSMHIPFIHHSKAEVNINLKGNTDNIKDVSTKSKGPIVKVNNLGKNMVPA